MSDFVDGLDAGVVMAMGEGLSLVTIRNPEYAAGVEVGMRWIAWQREHIGATDGQAAAALSDISYEVGLTAGADEAELDGLFGLTPRRTQRDH